ncbi:MAG: lysozyme, partial [Pseudomonadota bacterium]
SEAGIKLIKSFEGFRARAIQVSKTSWMVGYGHTRSARKGLGISRSDADAVLRQYDLPPVEHVIRETVHVPLNQNEFDALISFVFNIGREAFLGSDVLAYLNSGKRLAAAEAMTAWRKARLNGRLILVDALVRRRAAERALFLTDPDIPTVAPSPIIRPILDQSALRLVSKDRAARIFPASAAGAAAPKTNVVQPKPAVEATAPDLPAPAADAPEAQAERYETPRLTRVLGAPDSEQTAADNDRLSTPTPEDITRAISALTGASPTAEEVSDDVDLPHLPNDTIAIDDLEEAEVDPALVAQAIATHDAMENEPEPGFLAWVLYGGMGAIGLILVLAGLSFFFGAAADTTDGPVPTMGEYTGIALTLLGILLTFMAIYFSGKTILRGED